MAAAKAKQFAKQHLLCFIKLISTIPFSWALLAAVLNYSHYYGFLCLFIFPTEEQTWRERKQTWNCKQYFVNNYIVCKRHFQLIFKGLIIIVCWIDNGSAPVSETVDVNIAELTSFLFSMENLILLRTLGLRKSFQYFIRIWMNSFPKK